VFQRGNLTEINLKDEFCQFIFFQYAWAAELSLKEPDKKKAPSQQEK
jgi:hypothetical protein